MRKFIFISLVIYQFAFITSNSIFDYSHEKGDSLNILAGALSSYRAIIPFGYNKLNICQSKKIYKAEDTLGEILTGDSYYTTGYTANTNEDKFCQVLCYNTFDEKTVKIYKKLIKRRYFSNWVVDKLPAGMILYNQETQHTSLKYFNGIPLGFYSNESYYIYNHLQFHILLNKVDENKYNVVGFNILPLSIKHDDSNPICSKTAKDMLQNFELSHQPLKEGNILFTYDVVFEYSDITYASRWDHYKTSKSSIHWTGIFISEILVCFASFFIICLLKHNVNNDIDYYNYRVSNIEEIDEYDWKQVAGDVFRPPSVNPLLLSSLLGTGIQLLTMFTITLCLGVFGFMNPEKRANILNLGILFYCFCGLLGGYISANFYRFWGGNSWLKPAIHCSVFFPGTLLFGYMIVNVVLSLENSNAAVNFSDIISLYALWIFCTFPLILIGSFFGYKSNRINIPCDINKIPSVIPSKPWYLHYRYITFVTGFIGFATIFIEFNYVMASLWRHEIYFLASFLWITFLLFIIVVGEMTIIVVYFNLCYGDYNWWWKSFIIGSSPVIYFFLYSIFYFFYLKITRLSAMIVYFGLMAMISAMVILICGTVSVFFTMGFLNRIYSKIRAD